MKEKFLFKAFSTQLNATIQGCYFYSEKENKHYIVGESIDYGYQKTEVDPDTVKPVAMKVVIKPFNKNFGTPHCPNCDKSLSDDEYCPKCGQRIDWF